MDALARCLLLLVLLTASNACGGGPGPVNSEPLPGSGLRTRVVFTDGLSEHNDPVNELHRIPISDAPLYVHVGWLDIPPGEHGYKLEIYDGAGELVNVQRMRFENTEASWNTFSWYRPKPGVDAPGTWRFEIFLDGARVVSSELEIVP